MFHHEFMSQFDRLRENWGKNSFSAEKVAVIWRAVEGLDAAWFSRLIDHMVTSMRQAPMPSDFREAALKEKKRRFDDDVNQAASKWEGGEFTGLPKYLESIGAKSLLHAVEMERKRIRRESSGTP